MTDLSRSKLARDCGFAHTSWFSKAFREVFGETPAAFSEGYDPCPVVTVMDFCCQYLLGIDAALSCRKTTSESRNPSPLSAYSAGCTNRFGGCLEDCLKGEIARHGPFLKNAGPATLAPKPQTPPVDSGLLNLVCSCLHRELATGTLDL
jgi:hypothetical protein